MLNSWKAAARHLAALVLVLLLGEAALVGATPGDGGKWLEVDFPTDSPVLPVSFSLRPTTVRVIGSSMALDLHASLLLRNTGPRKLSGLTLSVEAQDLTPSGRGAVTVPSLEAQAGETFPVRIDLELRRPLSFAQSESAMVRVALDCALFADLTAYGPDQLRSRRSLAVYELQARRDRQYMAKLLKVGRIAEIREELNFGRQDLFTPPLGLELLRAPTTGFSEQLMEVRGMPFPRAPVQALTGRVQVAGNEVREPRIEVHNTSNQPVRSVDVGWLVRDENGREFVAGVLPTTVELGPVQSGMARSGGVLRFSRLPRETLAISSLVAFVSDVEFADGKLWIPSRSDIAEVAPDPVLRRALTNSPEQQRLAMIYRRKGISGLVEELKKSY